MGKLKVVVTDYIEEDLDWEAEECARMGADFTPYQLKFVPPGEVVEKCHDADFLVVDMAAITADIMDGLDTVKVIIRHGIGYDKVDIAAATRNGIIVANQADAFRTEVVEHTIALIFAVYRKLFPLNAYFRDSVRAGNWSYHEVYPVSRFEGKTLGIVGCGNIGSRVLQKMRAFGMNILVSDPFQTPEYLAQFDVVHTPIEQLLAQSDIVSLHLPLNDETRYGFDFAKLSMMKRTAMLINTARGPCVKTDDLIRALHEGVIAGAGLDVHEGEPPTVEHGFFDMPTVVCTPHFAWYSEEGGWEIRNMIMDDLRAFLAGKPPKHVLNPEVLTSPQLRMKLAE